ncbi:DUF2484 family protein [Aliiroseovarius crassostreae]|uniref:DUF2484 family protein n=1 Tax=Aliiroseovarius crassostreae TaxID=154981 RepID=UPI003C79D6F7
MNDGGSGLYRGTCCINGTNDLAKPADARPATRPGPGAPMSWTLLFACLWIIGAKLASMRPSDKKHWPLAYVLMMLGAPLVALAWWEHDWGTALLVLAAGMVVLRWPVIYLGRRIVKRVKGASDGTA